jgi:hypothetical protein
MLYSTGIVNINNGESVNWSIIDLKDPLETTRARFSSSKVGYFLL